MGSDIYSRVPVNGKAAAVVSQAGCEENLSADQERDNLRAKVAGLLVQLKSMPKTKRNAFERKRLGKQIAEINLQINSLKAPPEKMDLSRYILDVAKEQMTSFQWKKIVEEARRRAG